MVGEEPEILRRPRHVHQLGLAERDAGVDRLQRRQFVGMREDQVVDRHQRLLPVGDARARPGAMVEGLPRGGYGTVNLVCVGFVQDRDLPLRRGIDHRYPFAFSLDEPAGDGAGDADRML